jgi:hypothetical protein
MAHDYRNSTAQLAIEFATGTVITTNPGDNFMRVLIFIDKNPEYVKDESAFVPIDKDVDGVTLHDIVTLNKNNYASVADGRLLTWLTDLFCNGESYDCYVVRFGPAGGIGSEAAFTEDVRADLAGIYEKTKAVAYHKTILCQATDDGALAPAVALYFAGCCARDAGMAGLLSSAPYYPLVIPPDGLDLAAHPLYSVLKSANANALLTAHMDDERNGSLFRLGLALNGVNRSGTPVGNAIEMEATNLITPSGQPDPDAADFEYNDWEDYNLSAAVQQLLENNKVGYFRTLGDSTGRAQAVGDQTLNGDVMQAVWVVNFCNFVNKIKATQRISRKNTRRTAQVYDEIISMMIGTARRFGEDGSGALSGVRATAPAFKNLPASGGRELVVPNAWEANYVFGLRAIRVYGNLTIAF